MASMLYQHLPHVVGVVGSGQMGAGIVQLCAIRGMEVLLSDRKHDLLNHGLATVQRIMDKQIRKGLITADDAHAAMGRIAPSVSLEPFKRADFVFEAVSEDEELKKNVFRKLDQVTPVQTILASNTSSISVTRLAAVTSKPHRVIGMHFMHPVSDQPLCELSKGIHTSHGSFLAAKSLAEHMGKQVSVSEDRPGFILFRNLLPFINEAFFTVMEGVASADDVDRCLRLGTGMKLGPLKLADSIGLDTCLSIMKVLHQNLGDSKYRPCPLLVQYVDAGWLGVKTGKGVFHYPREDARPDSLDMEKLISQAHAHHHHLGMGGGGPGPGHDGGASPPQLRTLPPPPLPQELQRASSSSMPAL